MMMMSEAMASRQLPPHHHLDGPPPPPPPGLPMSIPCSSTSMFPGMLKLDKSVYSSPPPAANTPENNCCQLKEYRGHKVAAFSVDRRELICLPQAFELFLKHLVGGLHTVYTKLKRLGITPVVCNVEQVRILRGLGAIQPGVNRCKLIAPNEFDVLYEDCTSSSARPGRPPKRSSPSPHKAESPFRPKQPRLEGEVHPYPPYKWMDLMKTSPLFGNGYYYPPQMAAHLPFMPHPAMMNMAAMNGHLQSRHNAGILDVPKDLSSPIKDLSMDRAKLEELNREKNNNTAPHHLQLTHNNGDPEKPLDLNTRDVHIRKMDDDINDDSVGSVSDRDDISDVDLDLSSPSPSPVPSEHGTQRHMRDIDLHRSHHERVVSDSTQSHDNMEPRSQIHHSLNEELADDMPGPGSVVALLLNVQGLLRMAVESAKHREQKYNSDRADLKRDAVKEKERRENLETQLGDTQKTIEILQKKLRREKKMLRRIQESMMSSNAVVSHHMNSSSHMTGHMPVFPHPTQTRISSSSPNDSHFSPLGGVGGSSSGNTSERLDNSIRSNHSNDMTSKQPKHEMSFQDDDDSEVPRSSTSGVIKNGHTSPTRHDESPDGACED